MPPRLPRLRPASPEALAFGALWASLLDLALGAVILAWMVNAFAPPQDLPWKPFALDRPRGLATAVQFERAAASRSACRAALREAGITFTEEPRRRDGGCVTVNAVRLRAGVTPLSPAAPVMTCPLALAYALWDREALRPAGVARIEHYGTYACRNVYGRAGGRRSEHAAANALDVAAVRLTGGRRLSVARDFRKDTADGALIRSLRDAACQAFRATLSPDYNAAHADHLHLDRGRYRVCR